MTRFQFALIQCVGLLIHTVPMGPLGIVTAELHAGDSTQTSDPAQVDQMTVDRMTGSLATHDGYQFRAVAHEPLVVDPVSARLDGRGRLWVVEMPDYPTGAPDGSGPNGRIKILVDVDQDGLFDRSDLFADGLDFATGVQPYRDGAFVTIAGQIVFMRDRDGDNCSDEAIVLFRGFAEQNQQLRANHPTLGPDGLIYVSGGLRGGAIDAVDARYTPREQPLDIRDRDFAFDPEGGWWGAVAGKSQFGLTIDDFGRRIGCSNRNPAMTPGLSLDAIERDPLYAARDAVLDVAAAAEKSKVVSRADAWTTSNLHSGQFSAACGVFAPGIHDRTGEWMLVCEPTAYLVQQQRISRHGSVWRAERAEQAAEFFAATETWFRPVDITAGPAKSVLVIDMARAVIEHPDFMPPELKTRPDQRDGDDLGRIWQIATKGSWPAPRSLASSDQALQWLQSDSPWQRQMASQYFLESSGDHRASLGAIVLAESASPAGRSRAAWLLNRTGSLSWDQLVALLNASDARLRALALQLGSDQESWLEHVLASCDDADPLVRRHAAAAAGEASDHPDRRAAALAVAALKDTGDDWINRTIAAVDDGLVDAVAQQISASSDFNAPLLAHLIQRLAIASPEPAATVVIRVWDRQDLQPPLDVTTVEALEAWIDGNRKGRQSIPGVVDSLSSPLRERMRSLIQAVAMTAGDPSVDASLRARCITLSIATGANLKDLRGLFAEQSPPEVRVAALAPLLRSEREWMRQYLEENLTGMTIQLRSAALGACGSSPEDAVWLLDRIAVGSIPKTIIDPELAKRLRQHPNAEVAAKAEQLLRADPDRAKVLASYSGVSESLGDPLVGKRLFAEHCAACHHIDGVGTNVGPDISDTRTKSADALLISILDPNAAIDSSFVQFQVLTDDGRILDGLLIDETADAVTLQQKGGERITVQREEIDRVRSPGLSLMPEGFERTLDQPAMSHLLSYLKNWRYLKTSIPGTLPE